MSENFQPPEPISLIGMDILLAGINGLDAFEKELYYGTSLPGEIGLPQTSQPNRKETNIPGKILPGQYPQGSLLSGIGRELLLRVAGGALRDGGYYPTDQPVPVACFVTSFPGWLDRKDGSLSGSVRDDIQSSLGITGPILDLSREDFSLQSALMHAGKVLQSGQVEAVLVCAVSLAEKALQGSYLENPGGMESNLQGHLLKRNQKAGVEGACALLLKTRKNALRDQNRSYAVFQSWSTFGGDSPADQDKDPIYEPLGQGFAAILNQGEIAIDQVGLLDMNGSPGMWQNAQVLKDLIRVFLKVPSYSCALTGYENISLETSGVAQLEGLVRTTLCLHNRFIQAQPGGGLQDIPVELENGPFYLAREANPWLTQSPQEKRMALSTLLMPDGNGLVCLLEEEQHLYRRDNRALEQGDLQLFVLVDDDIHKLISRLQGLDARVLGESHFLQAGRELYQEALQKDNAAYCVSLLARDKEDLLKEIQFALKGLEKSIHNGMDWQTPQGSFFSPKPVGRTGPVAFVYPGGFNSYVGVGKDLFYLFPHLYKQVNEIVNNLSQITQERLLYPRGVKPFSPGEIAALENELINDPIAMLNSGSLLSIIFTRILQGEFLLEPAYCFGYSLGENSMMFASGIWKNGDEVAEKLNGSDLFRKRLAGPQNAVREYWGLPEQAEETAAGSFWQNYLLMASPDTVEDALRNEQRVYLTHINTPKQVVLGGDPQACERVISKIKCTHLQAPFHYALHCQAVGSELERLYQLHNWPVQDLPRSTLYTAANYRPINIGQEQIATSLARMLVQPLDFPRLVNEVYGQGARVFVELGAGANCSRWIDETLRGKPHLSVSANRKGMDDRSSILRLLARLTSHRVKVNLGPIYGHNPV